jgi:hypothetical protein
MIDSDLMVFYIAPTRFEFVLGYAFMSATYNKQTSNMQKKTKGKMSSFRRKKDTDATCNVLWAVPSIKMSLQPAEPSRLPLKKSRPSRGESLRCAGGCYAELLGCSPPVDATPSS